MRVLRLCSVYETPISALRGRGVDFDPIGGMQNYAAQLSHALDRLGIRQTVVTSRPPPSPAETRFGQRGTLVRLGLPVATCRQFYATAAWRKLSGVTRDVDVVHAHLGEDIAIMPLAVRAAALAAAPLVVTVHCSLRHTVRVNGPRSLALKVLGGAMETYGLDRADAVVALTERMRRRLPDHNVHVIPPGIGAEFTAARPLPEAGLPADIPRPRIGYVGRLTRQKGIDTLLRAVSLLPAGDGHLVLVGDGPQRDRLLRLAARLGITDRTHVLGFVPHRRIPAVLADIDVLVLPSHYEELSSLLMEAMYVGVPAVATPVGGIPELVEHRRSGLLVPPGTPSQLAAAIHELVADPVSAAVLVANAYQRVLGQTWERLAHRVLNVYRTVVPASSGQVHPMEPT